MKSDIDGEDGTSNGDNCDYENEEYHNDEDEILNIPTTTNSLASVLRAAKGSTNPFDQLFHQQQQQTQQLQQHQQHQTSTATERETAATTINDKKQGYGDAKNKKRPRNISSSNDDDTDHRKNDDDSCLVFEEDEVFVDESYNDGDGDNDNNYNKNHTNMNLSNCLDIRAITRLLITMFQESLTGTIDCNLACGLLNVPRDKLNDVIETLIGIGMVERRSNTILAWKGSLCLGNDDSNNHYSDDDCHQDHNEDESTIKESSSVNKHECDQKSRTEIDKLRRLITNSHREEAILDQWIGTIHKISKRKQQWKAKRNKITVHKQQHQQQHDFDQLHNTLTTEDIVHAMCYPYHDNNSEDPINFKAFTQHDLLDVDDHYSEEATLSHTNDTMQNLEKEKHRQKETFLAIHTSVPDSIVYQPSTTMTTATDNISENNNTDSTTTSGSTSVGDKHLLFVGTYKGITKSFGVPIDTTDIIRAELKKDNIVSSMNRRRHRKDYLTKDYTSNRDDTTNNTIIIPLKNTSQYKRSSSANTITNDDVGYSDGEINNNSCSSNIRPSIQVYELPLHFDEMNGSFQSAGVKQIIP